MIKVLMINAVIINTMMTNAHCVPFLRDCSVFCKVSHRRIVHCQPPHWFASWSIAVQNCPQFKVHCGWSFPVNVLQPSPLQCTSVCTLYIVVYFIVSLQWQYTKWCHDWVPSLQLTSLPPIVPLRLHHHHHHHLHKWYYHYYQKLCQVKSISHSNFLLFPFKSCCHLLLLPTHCPMWPTNIFQHRQHCCT